MLRPIFYIDINTYSDREMKNYANSYFFKMFKLLLIFSLDVITSANSSTQIACDVMVYNM